MEPQQEGNIAHVTMSLFCMVGFWMMAVNNTHGGWILLLAILLVAVGDGTWGVVF